MKTAIMLLLAATFAIACEPLDVQGVQSEDACEFNYAVPVPYQGCNKITGEFRVARFDIETQQCLLSELTYSCVGATEEMYVIGTHRVEEVEAAVANWCDVCNGTNFEALPLSDSLVTTAE
jgi:hypothetical protein